MNTAVVPALARVEARQLLRHPGTWVGLGLTGLFVFLIYAGSDGADNALFDPASNFALPVLLLAWGLLIAANLGALRSRRSGTDDLLTSTPTTPAAHTLGHVGGALAGVPVAAAVLAVSMVAWQFRPGTIGWPPPSLVLTLLLIVGGGAVVGVLVARWLPHPAAGAAAVIATIVLQSNMGHQDPQWRWLHFAPGDTFDSPFDVGPTGWHVVYVAGLVALGIALTVARHGLVRPVAITLAASVGVVTATGWIQTRPPDGAAVAHQVARLNDPAAHQVCERHGAVRYCAWSEYRGWIDDWTKPVSGVMALAPAAVRDRLTEVRQTTGFIELIPEIQRRLELSRSWPDDGLVHPGREWHARSEMALGYQAAARLVGLPASVGYHGAVCSAAGQARVIVAMWMAGKATPLAERSLRRRAKDMRDVGTRALIATEPLDVVPDYSNGGSGEEFVAEIGSAGRGADVVAAASLLALPVDRVSRAVTENWERLTAADAPAAAVFEAVGVRVPSVLAGRGPVVPGTGRTCT